MSVELSQRGMKEAVPTPVTAGFVGAALAALALLGEFAAAVAALASGAASTKAEGGRPPMVSASAAFSA